MYNDPARILISFKNGSAEMSSLDVLEEPFSETLHPLPPPYADGRLRVIAISDEIRLVTVRHGPCPQSIRIEGRNRPGTIEITFVLDARQYTVLIPGTRVAHLASSGNLLLCSPNAKPAVIEPVDHAMLVTNVSVSPGLVRSLMEDDGEAFDSALLAVVNEPGGEPGMLQAAFDPSISLLMASLDKPPYRGSLGRLFREARVYEILAGTLDGFRRADGSRPPRPISRGDRERMEEARGIIDANLATAPPLKDLARNVGTSITKLKRDFKRAHGVNVHEYVIAQRMDRAATLLAAGELSVKEAAFAVGYRSAEHFAQVFRRRYGRNPGSYAAH
jgi:AraC-like DNA-binding protein